MRILKPIRGMLLIEYCILYFIYRYDVILTAETIYSPDSYKDLHSILCTMLEATGVMYPLDWPSEIKCANISFLNIFLSRVGHLGPTLDIVMDFCESFFMNFGRFEWKLIAVFGSF